MNKRTNEWMNEKRWHEIFMKSQEKTLSYYISFFPLMFAKQKIMTIKWLEIWEENKNKNWTVSQNEIKIENIAYIHADNRNIFSSFFITQIIHSTCGWNIYSDYTLYLWVEYLLRLYTLLVGGISTQIIHSTCGWNIYSDYTLYLWVEYHHPVNLSAYIFISNQISLLFHLFSPLLNVHTILW
jgi:hypothetical protein